LPIVPASSPVAISVTTMKMLSLTAAAVVFTTASPPCP